MGISETIEHIWIKIKMPNPGQEPSVSSKAPNKDLEDMDILCTFKIKIESQILEYWYIRNHWTYLNQDQDAQPQSGTSSILQSPKWGLEGHGCSWHLQNQDRMPQFWSLVYQRPMTLSKSRSTCQTPIRNLQHQRQLNISESRSRCQTPIRNLQHSPKLQIRT